MKGKQERKENIFNKVNLQIVTQWWSPMLIYTERMKISNCPNIMQMTICGLE